MFPLLDKNRKILADLLRCDMNELVFITNCSVGMNAIIRSLIKNKEDKVLCFNTAYNSVEKTLVYVHDSFEAQLVQVELKYPLSDDEIVDSVRMAIEKENQESSQPIKLAVLDAITSVPGVRFPFERVVKLLKKYNILSCVDAAHALGQISVNLHEIDPDFFVTNAHKWLLCPRGLSVAYVPTRNQYLIHPAVINSAYKHHTNKDKDVTSNFQAEFNWPGTSDFSNFLCVEEVMKYRKSLGGEEKIMEYCHGLAVSGASVAADILGTNVLENDEETLTACMSNVRLPLYPHPKYSENDIIQAFIDKLIYEHNCMAPVYFHNNNWYVRFSAQVYNDLDDFKYVAKALLKVCKDLEQ
ncbi:unnamed protein product [Cunninghamella echinulata]